MKKQHMTFLEPGKVETCRKCRKEIRSFSGADPERIVVEEAVNGDGVRQVLHANCASPTIEAQVRAANYLAGRAVPVVSQQVRVCGYRERQADRPCASPANVRLTYDHPGQGQQSVTICTGHKNSAKARLEANQCSVLAEQSL